jgi:hypothetical protein
MVDPPLLIRVIVLVFEELLQALDCPGVEAARPTL